MKTNRLEAFSDGVLAIIITIMVLEIKIPNKSDFTVLKQLIPVLSTYLFSFIYVGIYWNNHHHILHIANKVNGRILWANLHLLFWLSLLPFATRWMGENLFENIPTAFYGLILLMCSIAWKILVTQIIQLEGDASKLFFAFQNDKKENLSLLMYTLGLIISFFYPVISVILFISVAIMWFIPDKRIERIIN